MDAADWDERYAASELVWSAEPNARLVTEVGDLPPGRALDLACGEGRNAIWLAERGWDVTAVDFSPVAIAKARRLAERRGVTVDWAVADLLEHRPAPAHHDLVVLLYLHIGGPGLARVVESAARAVAPDGTLLLLGHDRQNLEHGTGGPQDPALLWDAAEMLPLLGGFEVVRAGPVTREVPDADVPAIDTLVHAVRRAGS